MRGRKRKNNPKNRVISVRVTEEHFDILNKNTWIRKELISMFEQYLDVYTTGEIKKEPNT